MALIYLAPSYEIAYIRMCFLYRSQLIIGLSYRTEEEPVRVKVAICGRLLPQMETSLVH
jgi:hypothetical protein